jgi:spore germination protein GerM
VKGWRLVLLIALLAAVTFASWWFLAHRSASPIGAQIVVYSTKIDGVTESSWSVSMRPQQSNESAQEHLHNTALYAAVQAVAGPPPDVQVIRFPPGTHVGSVDVTGSTASVDLSGEVKDQVGGTLGESGEFKGLVYTLTALPGIASVQVTVDGHKLVTLPGGHLELDRPLLRSDW